MKRIFQFLCATALAGSCGWVASLQAQPAFTDTPDLTGTPPEIIPHRINPNVVSGAQPPTGSTSALSTIINHGGPVLSTPTVYLIWYGNWNKNTGSDTAAGQDIVRDFLNNLGGSPYYDINKSYSVSGNISFSGEATDNYSQGSRLSDAKVQAVVSKAISNGSLPSDPNALYFVLTSSDVAENSGFCTRYCGWHTHAKLSAAAGTDIKYSFVGNANRCLNACAIQKVGPNGNAGVDAMISVIAHELEETNTDPDLNAWYDSSGAENADKCAWTFGHSQYQTGNGAWANMQLGSRDFLVQRNLLRGTSAGDVCAISTTVDSNGNITGYTQ